MQCVHNSLNHRTLTKQQRRGADRLLEYLPAEKAALYKQWMNAPPEPEVAAGRPRKLHHKLKIISGSVRGARLR